MQADLFWIPGPWRGHLAIAARPRGGTGDDEASAWRRAGIEVVLSSVLHAVFPFRKRVNGLRGSNSYHLASRSRM